MPQFISDIQKNMQNLFVSKRQIFVLVTLILTTMLVVTQFSQTEVTYQTLLLLGVSTYVFSAIALREDLHGVEYVTLFILPVLFTIAVSLFYFLLPPRLLTRLPIAALYAIGMYAILLTENIYNVSAERSIGLVRAAHSVGFLITLITAFFIIEAIVSLHKAAWINGGLIIMPVFLLTLQSLWSMDLTTRLDSTILLGSGVVAAGIGELAFVLAFWPVKTTISALFLTTVYYTLVGMGQQHLVGRLFDKTKREFLVVLLLVVGLVLFATKWGFGNFV